MRESWRWFWRDLRQGELTLLLVALIVAVAATTSLRFFSSGVEKRMQQEAARLIAADLVVRGSRPLPEKFSSDAAAAGLQQAHTLEFSSVLVFADQFQLGSVKAVSPGYPLRGEIRLRDGDREKITHDIPAPGSIWLDERLLGLLKAKIGDTVQLGEKQLRISALLAYEPAQGGFTAFSPRALMHLDDVAATQVIQPGSRIRYQLLVSGDSTAVARYKDSLKPQLGLGMRLTDVREGRPEIGTPLTRSQSYFSLATMMAVVLAGLAIATSARRFAERHFDTLALLRCLGASRREALLRLAGEMFWLWLAAIIIGSVLGIAASQLLSYLLSGLLPVGDPLLTLWRPLLTGVATATLTLAGFALPALLELGRVSPLRVLRRELLPSSWSTLSLMFCAWLALLALVALETGAWRLTLSVMVGGSLFALLAWQGLKWLLQSWRRRFSHPALANALRDPATSSTQILGLALGLTALLLVATMRGELMQAWLKKIPADAPNQFAMNIADDEKAPFLQSLADAGIKHGEPYPVIRGRLTRINDHTVQAAVSKEEPEGERDESLNRELNLTWREAAPANKFSAGSWWPAGTRTQEGSNLVSVEKKLAERLKIKPGDVLHFTLAEGDLSATVSSLREVNWDSFQPNFYFIFTPGALDAFPASYLTSFRVSAEQRPVLNRLVQTFPTLILIDVDSVMTEVRRMLDQVARAVEAVLVFVLAGGMLVIWSHVLASLDARRFEAALLRVTGISRRELQWRLLGEFLFLGAMAGVMAALLNEVIAAVIYVQVLEITPTLHPALWWQAPLAGALLVVAAGLPGARQTWAASPMLVLRRG